ncbi:AcvB/VirJ family lysyl-phosphatidylglycerol hydrolase [uncultured Thiodictyon sp.]|uniref:AcvB/VirJ family lysyl-phosphatidylglycerol hydrolase n=1 Tax=uncultured Thiodictyon sp. TaxID=1846217 RepID=UPI0025FB3915|nr:AcvB/VirJ family lysyl-phosphatidylglycerol hydrolase [uncultured Thiodictyon sp.]
MPFATRYLLRSLPALLCTLLLARPAFAEVTQEQVASPVGTVHLVRPDGEAKGLVLYLPGARGWDAQAAATAREVAEQGHLVAGLEWSGSAPAAGQPAQCWDLADELDRLAHWVGARETLPKDALPTLLGESEGAALVYGALLQSPAHRFHAAITRGFCPRWPAVAPPCQREALTAAMVQGDRLLPATRVSAAWFLFDGAAACPADQVAAFANQVANARVSVDRAKPSETDGEDLSPMASFMQWLDPTIHDQIAEGAADEDIAGLPLIEVRAPQEAPKTFAVMLSGDGGWAAIDRGVSAQLAAKGISTVGWDSLSYFWKPRTPTEAAEDLAQVVRHYLAAWHKERVILIGYSFGAEVLSFMANGLPADLRPRVQVAAFLGLGRTAMFEFHLGDWLNTERGAKARPVLPQMQALGWTRGLCVYGADEEESLCPDLAGLGIKVHKVAGDHHFDDDYPKVADLILASLATP